MKAKEKIDFPLESFVDPLLSVEDDKPIPPAVTEAMPSDVVEVTEDLECLLLPTEQEDSILVESDQPQGEVTDLDESLSVSESEDSYRKSELAIRTRIVVVYNDIVELVKSWGSGEGKPSNKLVDDLLQPLGSELNEINGYDKGFSIDEDE